MSDCIIAASPVELRAKAEEAGLPKPAGDAAEALFHALTGRLGLAAVSLDRHDGEEWPRHRFYYAEDGSALAAAAALLRAQPEVAEVVAGTTRNGAAPDTIFAWDAGPVGAGLLLACDNPDLLRRVAEPVEARLRAGGGP